MPIAQILMECRNGKHIGDLHHQTSKHLNLLEAALSTRLISKVKDVNLFLIKQKIKEKLLPHVSISSSSWTLKRNHGPTAHFSLRKSIIACALWSLS